MACLDSYATPAQYSEWWGYWQHKIEIADLTPEEVTALENQIKMAAGQINLSMSQVGACDCSLAAGATEYLKQLNIIATAVVYRVPCGPRLSDDERKTWLEYLNNELVAIREGRLELCAGYTGANFPAWGSAQPNWTPFTERQLIIDGIKRDQL